MNGQFDGSRWLHDCEQLCSGEGEAEPNLWATPLSETHPHVTDKRETGRRQRGRETPGTMGTKERKLQIPSSAAGGSMLSI